MKRYTEATFLIEPLDPWRDLLIAELGELGYDSFEETSNGVNAYISADRFDRAALHRLEIARQPHVRISHTVHEVEPRNWNAEWERSFQPVEVGMDVRIRADFHPFVPGSKHDIVITPRMAFGTGHHATTRMMVEAMLGLDMRGQHVCDLGCGTAVLAILAERLGAASVEAIDNDPQATANARENIALNGCTRITVRTGDVSLLAPATCGIILANIERNTLMRDMEAMYNALLPGGSLLLSGFVVADRQLMSTAAHNAGLHPEKTLTIGDWTLIACRK